MELQITKNLSKFWKKEPKNGKFLLDWQTGAEKGTISSKLNMIRLNPKSECVKCPIHEQEGEKIMVLVDGSEPADHAFGYAMRFKGHNQN